MTGTSPADDTSVGSSKHADDRDNVWHSGIYNMPFVSWLGGTFDKSDPAATQGHLRSRHAQSAKIIGGSGLKDDRPSALVTPAILGTLPKIKRPDR